MDALTALALAVAAILVVVGIVGTVAPVMPGAVIVFAGLFLAAWAEGFVHLGWGWLLFLAALAALTYVVDFAATALGAKKLGASRRAMVGAALGALAGLFFGLAGVLIGPFAGAVLAELSNQKGFEAASRAGLGAWIGMVFGAAAKLALVFMMVGVYAVVRLF